MRLAYGCPIGSAQDTFVVRGNLRDGFLLERPKLTPKLRFNRRARVPFVPSFGPDLPLRRPPQLVKRMAPPRSLDPCVPLARTA